MFKILLNDKIVSPGDLLEVQADCMCQGDIRRINKMFIEVKHAKPELKTGDQVFFIDKIRNRYGDFIRVNHGGHIYELLESQLKPR